MTDYKYKTTIDTKRKEKSYFKKQIDKLIKEVRKKRKQLKP